ncbi:hypothetical protein HU200_043952 [Digitaria exilis]|uniref:Uncharacterized protein n=1 Tax=Digitaria exilis TaxID=1010633 RepID=A0A835B8H6_9POAL|nr:hypothetical protein HU200_043952 [Digitaria exilis]
MCCSCYEALCTTGDAALVPLLPLYRPAAYPSFPLQLASLSSAHVGFPFQVQLHPAQRSPPPTREMRRRRWAPLAAAAVCLVVLFVALLADVHGARGAAAPVPAARRGAAATAAFDAAARVARCKEGNSKRKAGGGAACAGFTGGDDDDMRVVPTGANPLHNRQVNEVLPSRSLHLCSDVICARYGHWRRRRSDGSEKREYASSSWPVM